jgi:4-aminobutyrate aminotransferase-like enzyme
MLAAMTNNAANKRSDFKMSRQRPYFIFLLLFEECAIRITPPLTISDDEIREGCAIMLEVMDEVLLSTQIN